MRTVFVIAALVLCVAIAQAQTCYKVNCQGLDATCDSTQNPCKSSFVCDEDEKCEIPQGLGGDCSDNSNICNHETFCNGTDCLARAAVTHSCSQALPCVFGAACVSGTCVAYNTLNKGDVCAGFNAVCKDGLRCAFQTSQYVCTELLTLNSTCTFSQEYESCEIGTSCISNECRPMGSVPLDSSCYMPSDCQLGLTCGHGYTCVAATTSPLPNSCNIDSDCPADAFCGCNKEVGGNKICTRRPVNTQLMINGAKEWRKCQRGALGHEDCAALLRQMIFEYKAYDLLASADYCFPRSSASSIVSSALATILGLLVAVRL